MEVEFSDTMSMKLAPLRGRTVHDTKDTGHQVRYEGLKVPTAYRVHDIGAIDWAPSVATIGWIHLRGKLTLDCRVCRPQPPNPANGNRHTEYVLAE